MNKLGIFTPRIDTHIHLDGSLPIPVIEELCKRCGIDLSGQELKDAVTVNKECKDLNDYLEKFELPVKILQTKENLIYATRELLNELEKQGLFYVELRFAPQLHTQCGLTQDDVVEAVVQGIKESKLPNTNLILCLMRGKDNEKENGGTIAVATSGKFDKVRAVDLAGAEGLFKTEKYINIFSKIKSEGKVDVTIHAGEADGPSSIKDAIYCGASRIGHGVRALEDPVLMEYLKDSGITLEICPTSNLDTGIFENISDLPIREFIDKGIKFSINTDDMTVSNTTLEKEYDKVIDAFDLSRDELYAIVSNSVQSTFLTFQEKNILLEKVLADAFPGNSDDNNYKEEQELIMEPQPKEDEVKDDYITSVDDMLRLINLNNIQANDALKEKLNEDKDKEEDER